MSADPQPKVDGRAARRGQTRAAVLASAATIFADQGFAATGVEQIAAAAGVSKGSVFYGFSTKEALFVAVMQEATARVGQLLDEARDGLSGWAALQAQAWRLLQGLDGEAPLGHLLLREIFAADGPWAAHRPQARARILAPLVASLEEIRDELDGPAPGPDGDEAVAVAVLGALVFAALDRSSAAPGRSLQSVHERLMSVLGGLSGGRLG